MTSTALSFLVACAVAAVLTPLAIRLAEARGLLEGADNVLKIHERRVPRVGGIAIVLGFFAPLAGIFVLGAGITVQFGDDHERLLAFCAGGIAIFALGLWDDLRGLAAPVKLLVEVAVAASVWLAGFRVEVLVLPWLGPTELGVLGPVVTVLWIVGVTNALNLVDGLDGLAAGVAFFAAAAHVVIGVMHGDLLLSLFGAALGGAVLGFLPYNFHPARIFMGDSGALFLGYALAMSSIYSATHKSTTAVAVLGPILILGLPLLDTSLAVLRRGVRGQPLFDGDRGHVHHRLLDLGLSQRLSVVLLYALCAAFAFAGLMATLASHLPTALVLVSLLVMLAVFERRLGLLRGRTEAALASSRALEAVRRLRADASRAASLEDAWVALVDAGEPLGFQRLRLQRPGEPDVREWSRPHPAREGTVALRVRVGRASEDRAPRPVLELDKRPFRRGMGLPDELFALLLEEVLADVPTAGAVTPRARPAPAERPLPSAPPAV